MGLGQRGELWNGIPRERFSPVHRFSCAPSIFREGRLLCRPHIPPCCWGRND